MENETQNEEAEETEVSEGEVMAEPANEGVVADVADDTGSDVGEPVA